MERLQSQPGRTATEALSAENLAQDFGAKADVTRHGVRALHEAVLAAEPPALQQWKALFGKAAGYDPPRASAKIERLAECYSLPTGRSNPDAVLFALHTYYALLVRLLVGQVVAHCRGLPRPAERLLQADACGRLWREMEQLEADDFLGGLNVADIFRGDPFSWYTAAGQQPKVGREPIRRLIRQLAARLEQYDPHTLSNRAAISSEGQEARPSEWAGDLLGGLYQRLFPRALRHQLGEYYTPGWLADHVLEVVGYSGLSGGRLLDPACGSGTFLLAAIRRVRRWYESDRERCRLGEGELCRKVLANVVGFDLNPLAVMAARANYLIAICDLIPQADRVEIPVHLCDSILDGPISVGSMSPCHTPPPQAGRFDYVVGNPPWIAWDNLPAEYRRATTPLWERYGLFSLSGSEARHGGAKKDLSMLMMYTSADRFLKHGGRLAMVITQTLFQTKGAGDGFRRFRLGAEGEPLKVLRVDDMVALRPFQDAANFTSTILLQKGAPTRYPVPYVKWSSNDDQSGYARRTYQAEPIDSNRPGPPWFLRPEGLGAELARLVGKSDYVAHLGANSGGANGVYWLESLGEAQGGVLVRNLAEKNKRSLKVVEQVVEPDLLYPLVRWIDLTRYRASPSAHILLAQDAVTRTGIDRAVMGRKYPKTYAYLQRFERVLSGRAAYRQYQQSKAFYSMYNVGTYTLAPIKVVWRRMDRRINAAVVEQVHDPLLGPRPVIPQETCVLIAADSVAEAHYVCAVLNSSIVNFLVASHSVCGGKGFGTPGMLDFIKLVRFDPGNPRHTELSACSRMAHMAAACGNDPAETQRRIDQLAGELWELEPSEIKVVARA
ncbi:MAG: N-6 DNA methylase [Planctomycetota bacterium]|jgi:SAM-dependent methyltransferase